MASFSCVFPLPIITMKLFKINFAQVADTAAGAQQRQRLAATTKRP